MRILFVSKQDTEGISTDEVIDIFANTEDLDEIKNIVEGAQDRISVTWASVEMKDRAGELIPIDDIIKQQDILLERNGPRSDEHTNRIIGETLAYKVLEHPKTKSLGVLHLDKTFDHNELDDKVWNEIKSGEREGDSVGGFNTNVSEGHDEVTGEEVKVLEGFNQLETASVREPCNPESLTEAFSVIAKSNRRKICGGKCKMQVKKPEKLDRCVESLMSDPDFKPEDPTQTKEQAAFAVCTAALKTDKESKKFWDKIKTNINKPDIRNNTINSSKNEGDTMSKDVIKAISELKDTIKVLQKDVASLKQDDEEKPEEEEKKKQVPPELEDEEEEKKKIKKQEEEEEKQEEDEEKKKTKKQEEDEEEKQEEEPEEEEKKKIKKEEAKGDIEGEEPAADQPEAPEEPDINDADVFKLKQMSKEFKALKKQVASIASTPRPNQFMDVNKTNELSSFAKDLANRTKKSTWQEVHKKVNDYQDSTEVV